MIKKGDDDDDEVSIYTVALSSYQQRGVGGQEKDGQRGTYRWSTCYLQMVPAGFSAPGQNSIQLNRIFKLYYYVVTAEDK
jgi:hypothetical protein